MWLQSEDAYEGCLLERHLLLTDEWLLDWFEVSLAEEQTMDWWMHAVAAPNAVDGKWVGLTESAAEVLGSSNCGYDRIQGLSRYERNVRTETADTPSVLTCSYSLNEASMLYQSTITFAGDSLYRIETPGTSIDPSEQLSGLLHRHKGRKARFVHLYKLGSAAPVRWQTAAGSEGAGSGQLIIQSQNGEAVCELLSEQGLNVIWRERQ